MHVMQRALLPFLVAHFAAAYFLDPGCYAGGVEKTQLLRETIEDAFALAQTALNFFDRRNAGTADAYELRLFNLLVNGDGNGQHARDSYSGILHENYRVEELVRRSWGTPIEPELIIYCDETWKEYRTVAGRSAVVDMKSKLAFHKEVLTDKAVCKVAHAFTASASVNSGRYNSYIQICPWFFNTLSRAEIPRPPGFLSKVYWGWGKFGQALKIFRGRSDVDAYATADVTILHELMHTTRAGVRDDIAGNYGSYDWKNAVSLRTRSGGDNWNNADNLAYFALALRMKEAKLRVQDDGEVVRL